MVDRRTMHLGHAVLLAAALLAARDARATMPPYSGDLPETVREAFSAGAFRVPTPLPPADSTALPVSAGTTSGVWRVPVILASYQDVPLQFDAAAFESTLFDTGGATATGSVFDYYRWASRGRLTLVPEIVATVRLPNTRHYYAWTSFGLGLTSTPNNSYGAIRDALILCQNDVDWSRFDRDRDGYVDMLWFVHAGTAGEASGDRDDLWSITSSASNWRNGEPYTTTTRIPGTFDRYMRVDRFTTLPELSTLRPGQISEIGVYCHEFGHALGLPDLYDTSAIGGAANGGPGNWSLMASGGYGSNGVSPESPSHLGAWPLQFLGWDRTIRPARDTTLALGPLFEANDVLELWFEGGRNSEHFLVENRQRGPQFDRTLPMEGLIVYHVDDMLLGARTPHNSVNVGPDPALVLVEADGDGDLLLGRNRGDGSDPFPGALQRTRLDDHTTPNLRTFRGNVTQLAMSGITRSGDDVRFQLQVRAPNWAPIQDVTSAGYAPFGSYGPAPTAGADERGVTYLVRSERRDGRPQIVLVSSDAGWIDPFPVSLSPGAAFEPTLAVLPGGDLAIAWTDTRHGRSTLYYRSRVRGAWSPERRLVDVADASAPALASDPRGMLHLAFLGTRGDSTLVHFMRFTYRSPYGRPRAVHGPGVVPSPPAITVAPDGSGQIVWTQRIAGSQARGGLWFASHHPDSGVGPATELTRSSFGEPVGLAAVADAEGTLHVVWLTSAPGSHQLHYHRRSRSAPPAPRDSVIVSRGLPLQPPSLAVDPEGGLHLAYEVTLETGLEVRYRQWRPEQSWDAESTLLSGEVGGNAVLPAVVPIRADHVVVAFTGYPSSQPRFLIRRRATGDPALPPYWASPAPAMTGRAGPNPARRGARIELEWEAPGAAGTGIADVFDLGGRRIGTVALAATTHGWRAALPGESTRDWSPGIYFARPRTPSAAVVRWVMLP